MGYNNNGLYMKWKGMGAQGRELSFGSQLKFKQNFAPASEWLNTKPELAITANVS